MCGTGQEAAGPGMPLPAQGLAGPRCPGAAAVTSGAILFSAVWRPAAGTRAAVPMVTSGELPAG